MFAEPFIRRVFFRLAAIILITASFNLDSEAKRKTPVPGQQGIVIDERLSALRARPDVKAALERRLRRGRMVGILGFAKGKGGTRFWRVSVSRNTQGWVLANAIARLGNPKDAARLMQLIEETTDDFTKARLARLCADEFRSTSFAPRALIVLGDTSERVAAHLTREAKRKVAGDEVDGRADRQIYLLNFTGLDRYNRIGVTFDYDPATDRIVYDGGAYRQLLRRYPSSPEAKTFKKRSAAGNKVSSSER